MASASQEGQTTDEVPIVTVQSIRTYMADNDMLVVNEREKTVSWSQHVARSTMNELVHMVQRLDSKLQVMDYLHTSLHWDKNRKGNTHLRPGAVPCGLHCTPCATTMTVRTGGKNAPRIAGSRPAIYTGPAGSKMRCVAAHLAQLRAPGVAPCSACPSCQFLMEHQLPGGFVLDADNCGCRDCRCVHGRGHKADFSTLNRFNAQTRSDMPPVDLQAGKSAEYLQAEARQNAAQTDADHDAYLQKKFEGKFQYGVAKTVSAQLKHEKELRKEGKQGGLAAAIGLRDGEDEDIEEFLEKIYDDGLVSVSVSGICIQHTTVRQDDNKQVIIYYTVCCMKNENKSCLSNYLFYILCRRSRGPSVLSRGRAARRAHCCGS